MRETLEILAMLGVLALCMSVGINRLGKWIAWRVDLYRWRSGR